MADRTTIADGGATHPTRPKVRTAVSTTAKMTDRVYCSEEAHKADGLGRLTEGTGIRKRGNKRSISLGKIQHPRKIDEGGLRRRLAVAEPWDGPELLPST